MPKDLPSSSEMLIEWSEESAWFKERCAMLRPLWDLRIKEVEDEEKAAGDDNVRTKAEIGKSIADNSTTDLQRLENELVAMQARTSIIVAAATLMFAVFVLKGSASQGVWMVIGIALLTIALLATAVSFILAIKSLTPPIRKAWGKPYAKRIYWDLLVASDFHRYVMNSDLAESRTPIITKYKKAHSVAIPLLVVAAALTVPGLAMVLLG